MFYSPLIAVFKFPFLRERRGASPSNSVVPPGEYSAHHRSVTVPRPHVQTTQRNFHSTQFSSSSSSPSSLSNRFRRITLMTSGKSLTDSCQPPAKDSNNFSFLLWGTFLMMIVIISFAFSSFRTEKTSLAYIVPEPWLAELFDKLFKRGPQSFATSEISFIFY